MIDKFDQILTWSKLPLKTRYNFLLGTIIFVLISSVAGIITHYERKITKNRNERATTINRIVTRYRADLLICNEKLEENNKQFILYLKKSNKELQDIFETIKNQQ